MARKAGHVEVTVPVTFDGNVKLYIKQDEYDKMTERGVIDRAEKAVQSIQTKLEREGFQSLHGIFRGKVDGADWHRLKVNDPLKDT